MTWNINFTGHSATQEEEELIKEKARVMAASLEGLSAASFSGMHTGSESIMSAREDAIQEEIDEGDTEE